MELVKILNTDDDNSFDPTPKLKSSPIPINFISFNKKDVDCIYCGEKYTETILSHKYDSQKYCKKCLLSYITDITKYLSNYITNITECLDVYYTRNIGCIKHEIDRTKQPQNIQECCRNCLEICLFKQIPMIDCHNNSSNMSIYSNVIESEKYCKLCGK